MSYFTSHKKELFILVIFSVLILPSCSIKSGYFTDHIRQNNINYNSKPKIRISKEAYYNFIIAQISESKGDFDNAILGYKKVIKHDPNTLSIYKNLASIYIRKRYYKEAIDTCREALLINPDYSPIIMMLADLYSSFSKFDLAIELYKKSIDIDKENSQAYLSLGVILTKQGKNTEAINALDKYTKSNFKAFHAFYYIARNYAELRDFVKSEDNFKRAIEINPYFEEAMEGLGIVYQIQKKYDDAIDVFKNAIELNPKNSYVRDRLGELYIHKDSFDDALTEYKTIRDMEPDNAKLRLKIALIYYEKQEYLKALEEFQMILASSPENLKIHQYISAIYEDMERYSDALSELEYVLAKNPESMDIIFSIARIYDKLNDTKNTVKILNKGVIVEPENSVIHYYLGIANFSLKKYNLAEKNYKAAIDIEPLNDTYLYYLGMVYEKLNDYNSAKNVILRALDLNPGNHNAHNFIGYLYADKGENLDRAILHVKKALDIEPDNAYFLDSLGWAYYKKGMFELARTSMEKAALYLPEDPVVNDHLGDILFELSNYNKAIESWEKSLKANEINKGAVDNNKVKDKLKRVKILLKQKGSLQ